MDFVDAEIVIKDFKSIKVPHAARKRINDIHDKFNKFGFFEYEDRLYIIKLYRKYIKKFRELYESREKAKITNALKSIGLTRDEASRRIEARKSNLEKVNSDVGF